MQITITAIELWFMIGSLLAWLAAFEDWTRWSKRGKWIGTGVATIVTWGIIHWCFN